MALAGLLFACALGAAHLAFGDPPPWERRRVCVQTLTEVRENPFGFEHWVHLINHCPQPMVCTVRTDTNPQTTVVKLAAREQNSVMMARSSPENRFNVRVRCRPRPVAPSSAR